MCNDIMKEMCLFLTTVLLGLNMYLFEGVFVFLLLHTQFDMRR